MNIFIVSGRLTDKPNLKYSKKNYPFCTLKVANNDCKTPVYIDIKVFGKDAEHCFQYLDVGRMVEVRGRFEKGKEQIEYISDEVIFADMPKKKDIMSDDF